MVNVPRLIDIAVTAIPHHYVTLPPPATAAAKYDAAASCEATLYRSFYSDLVTYDRTKHLFNIAGSSTLAGNTVGELQRWVNEEVDDVPFAGSVVDVPGDMRFWQTSEMDKQAFTGKVYSIIDYPEFPDGHMPYYDADTIRTGWGFPASTKFNQSEPGGIFTRPGVGGIWVSGTSGTSRNTYEHPYINDRAFGLVPGVDIQCTGLTRVIEVSIERETVASLPGVCPVFEGAARLLTTYDPDGNKTGEMLCLPQMPAFPPGVTIVDGFRVYYEGGEVTRIFYTLSIPYTVHIDGIYVRQKIEFRMNHFGVRVEYMDGSTPKLIEWTSDGQPLGGGGYTSVPHIAVTREMEGDYKIDLYGRMSIENIYNSALPTVSVMVVSGIPKVSFILTYPGMQPVTVAPLSRYELQNIGPLSQYTGTDGGGFYIHEKTALGLSARNIKGINRKLYIPFGATNPVVWRLGNMRAYISGLNLILFYPDGSGYHVAALPVSGITGFGVTDAGLVVNTAGGSYVLELDYIFDFAPPDITVKWNDMGLQFIPCLTHCLSKGGVFSKVE